MPYFGKSPEHGNFTELTDVSGSFDGSDTAFALTSRIGGIAITPVVEAAILISINGVIQEPTTDYTVSGTNITFTTAPASGDSFFGIVMGRQLDVGTPSDSTVTPAKMNISSALVPASADGAALGSTSAEWSDLYLADSSVIYFGNDQDVTVTHDPDDGLFLKSTATADDNPFLLTLQTGETDMAADDVIGKIAFQAPDEGTGTDAILVSAAIQARAEGDHSSSSNATSLDFMTGASEAAAKKMSVTSGGDVNVLTDGASVFFGADSEIELRHVADDGLILKHVGTGDGKEPSLTFQAGDNDIAANDVLGSIFFQAPDEGAGTDAILVAAGIEAVSEGDFSSSNNATKLSFKTGASEAAAEKMSLSSTGNLTISGDLTVSGDDLTMGTNTSGAALIADGTNFNPVVISGDISIATNGVAAIGSGVIVAADIASNAVETAKINADAVTNAKIADDALDSEHYSDGSIDTAHIADNQITLAKMAGLARGKIIYGDASGDPAALAVGTANYVLTSDGTDIAWAAEGSIGLHTIFIPAAAMRPTKSNGCGSIADTETTSGRPDLTGLPFDDGSDEHAQFQVALPKQWNLGTVTYQVFWASTATDTDGVSWALQGCSVPDNSTIDLAYGTAIVVDDANQGAAEELCVSAVSSAVTIAGTPADDDMCFFRVFRDVSDGNDTAAEDAILIGIKLFITTDVGNDA